MRRVCDYCDCRSRPLLRRLGADHERIAALAAQARRDPSAGGPLADAVAADARLEEAGLYRELAAAGVAGIDTLAADHARLDAALHAAARGGDAAELGASLDELAAHIRAEEYDLFPAAHQLLDDAAWDRVDRLGG